MKINKHLLVGSSKIDIHYCRIIMKDLISFLPLCDCENIDFHTLVFGVYATVKPHAHMTFIVFIIDLKL